MAAAGLLVLAGILGVVNPSDLVWVERLFDHPFMFGVAAATLFGYGMAMLPERVWVGLLLAVPCLVVACGWGGFGVFWSYESGSAEVAVVAAPNGEGRDFEAVVEEGGGFFSIETVWNISIRQTGTPFARQWEVGCISGDAVDFEHIEWNGREQLVVQTSDGPASFDVNARTGRPIPAPDGPRETCTEH